MKHIALYVRVSTQDQSTDSQKIRLIEWAKKNEYTYDLFEEVESTRKTRPVKQSMLSKLRAGEYDAVAVYKLDRYARSSTELILETKELIDKGIGFISLTDNLDFTTATGTLYFHILAAFAQFERSLISDRTKNALQRKREAENYVFKGRKKGSKDLKKRKTDGYLAREENKRQLAATKQALPPNNGLV